MSVKAALIGLSILTFPHDTLGDSAAGPKVGDSSCCAQQRPELDPNGTVHIPHLAVPLSPHMSEEAKKAFVDQFTSMSKLVDQTGQESAESPADQTGSGLATTQCPLRKYIDEYYQPLLARAKSIYPVHIEKKAIGGIETELVTPKAGVASRNRHRVLINLHGGGYNCATAGGLAALVEAVPIAAVGKFRVIAVDYRTSPKYRFPAATEDVTTVYKALLKRYRPENIGMFGCSTGATLAAGSLAWFQKEHLPRPGAVGLFGDGATKDDHVDGDGWFINVPLAWGKTLAPNQSYQVLSPEPYMAGADYNDPLVAPIVSLSVLSKFPPTLVVSGTRDVGLSEALYTHTQLVKAGATAELHVWEGMWHCFFFDVNLPESKDEYDVVATFFDRHLGKQ